MSRRLAVAPLLAAALAVASPAAAVDRRAEAVAADAIKKAASDYLATNYEGAAARLKKAVKTCGASRCTPGTRAALLRDLGTMQFRNGDLGAAKRTWGDAFKIQADLVLSADYDTPDLRAAFEEAHGTSGAMGEQPAGDFSHTPAGEQKVDTPVPVYVEYSGSTALARVLVKYKGAAMNDWGRVELQRMGGGWGAQIPCPAATKGVLRYWVQGFDDGGDPVASSGDPKHPFAVRILDDISGDAPHLPGKSPPKSCGEDTDCPAGLPGCAPEAKSTDGDDTTTDSAPPVKPGSYVKYWFGLAGTLDFISMPAGQDVCRLNPQNAAPANPAGYYCTNPDGSDFPLRNDGGAQNNRLHPGQAGTVAGGLQPGNVRVMLSFDYALSASLLVGGRLGYVLNAYTGSAATSDGRAFGPKLDLEVRGTYLFGKDPLANVGFAPMAFIGGGVSEFDGHRTTIVLLTSQQPVDAWITDGPAFFEAGAGVRYAFSLRAAFTLAARFNGAFGNGFLATYGPEAGIQYGF